jgi:hypothetical protein
MKRKIILLFMCVVLYALNAHAELNYFLPRSNAVMSILDRKYHFEGDTIIEGKKYTKVYEQYCYSETECGDLSYYAAVREDTIAEKIYCIQVDDGVERLLMDFNVNENDIITVYSYVMTPFYHETFVEKQTLWIVDIDSIMIDNQYRKKVNITYNDAGSHNIALDSFVEGLGSIEHGLFFLLDIGIPDARAEPILLCLHIDNILIYQKYDYNTCYLKDNGVKIKEIQRSELKIYPTIVNDNLYVDTNQDSYSYKIYTIQGKIMKSGFLSKEPINVSILNKGVYYILFYNDNNFKLYSNKFIKH